MDIISVPCRNSAKRLVGGTVELLQRALDYFRKPQVPPPNPLRTADLDERVGGSRSKRAQIKSVLRRYEQGAITQVQAVEEILKVMR
jgi:hypothetical protein